MHALTEKWKQHSFQGNNALSDLLSERIRVSWISLLAIPISNLHLIHFRFLKGSGLRSSLISYLHITFYNPVVHEVNTLLMSMTSIFSKAASRNCYIHAGLTSCDILFTFSLFLGALSLRLFTNMIAIAINNVHLYCIYLICF